MGIFRKLLRFYWSHGPGSVGSVAKTMTKTYSDFQRRYPEKSKKDLIILTLKSRYPFEDGTKNIVGQSLPASAEFIVEGYGDSLHNAIMIVLSVEHPEISQVSVDVMSEVNDIIDEMIRKYAPDAVS